IIDVVGLNCAACHVGSIRESPDATPLIYPAMPSNTVDLLRFFQFLFDCANDPLFTPEAILANIRSDRTVLPPDRIIYKIAIQRMKDGLMQRRAQIGFLFAAGYPQAGPGRVDTFNPYKAIQFASYYTFAPPPREEHYANVDFPSIWNQAPREGLHLHWDGNNSSVHERNVSAAFGAGATAENVDLWRIGKVERWLR